MTMKDAKRFKVSFHEYKVMQNSRTSMKERNTEPFYEQLQEINDTISLGLGFRLGLRLDFGD